MNFGRTGLPLFNAKSMVTSTGVDSGLSIVYITLNGNITSLQAAQQTIDRFTKYAGNLNGVHMASSTSRASDNSTMTISMEYGFEAADDATYICERADRALSGNTWHLDLSRSC